MRVCFVSSEVHPFAKTGGLADVSAALCKRLHRLGHDVRLFTPAYGSIGEPSALLPPGEITLQAAGRPLRLTLREGRLAGSDIRVHLISCPELYDRGAIYTDDPDEAVRFAMLARTAIESCRRTAWAPEVFHCHDWHAALIPVYLKGPYRSDPLFHRSKTVLTIHNLGYQGVFPARVLRDIALTDHAHLLHGVDLRGGRIGFLKSGILHADAITTVSPTYAREICTPEYGFGLHEILAARSGSLTGILNGVDYDEWSPEKDRHIPFPYSAETLHDKESNKRSLLDRLGLADGPDVPAFGVVSRLAYQKGFDLCFDVLPDLLSRRDLRLVVLGEGEARYESFFESLERRFPSRVRFRRGHDETLAHRIEAGCDFFLMPSRYEPCGLNQMYSLRYGTIPIVRKTGGLADTVRPFDGVSGTGTGFVFEHFTPDGLRWAMEMALSVLHDDIAWGSIRRNAMAEDFSWDRQVHSYEALYRRLSDAPSE